MPFYRGKAGANIVVPRTGTMSPIQVQFGVTCELIGEETAVRGCAVCTRVDY